MLVLVSGFAADLGAMVDVEDVAVASEVRASHTCGRLSLMLTGDFNDTRSSTYSHIIDSKTTLLYRLIHGLLSPPYH